jgi:hypothetical protein
MDRDSYAAGPAAPGLGLMISLWGASQAGKTTTLAAYFGKQTPEWVDQGDQASRETLFKFRETWDALRRNQIVAGTTAPATFTLRHRDGLAIGFRDMQGGNARYPDRTRESEPLFQSDAAIVFYEWPGQRAANNEAAVENALIGLLPRHPTALAITKCEAQVTEADFLRFAAAPMAFAARHPPLAPLLPMLQRYTRHFRNLVIAPITVYGWNAGRPAHSYDEFGRLVPWNIQPAEVERPFDFVLHSLRSAAGSGGRP